MITNHSVVQGNFETFQLVAALWRSWIAVIFGVNVLCLGLISKLVVHYQSVGRFKRYLTVWSFVQWAAYTILGGFYFYEFFWFWFENLNTMDLYNMFMI